MATLRRADHELDQAEVLITLGATVDWSDLKPSGGTSVDTDTGLPPAAGGAVQDSGSAGVPSEYLEDSFYQRHKVPILAGAAVLVGGALVAVLTRKNRGLK